MHLLGIIAVLAALVLGENCPQQPVRQAGVAVLGVAAILLVPPAFAALAARWIVRRCRRGEPSRSTLLRWMKRIRIAHGTLWLAGAGAALGPLGWPRLVRFNWGLDGAFLLDELLLLLPVFAPLVLSWTVFYEADREFRAQLNAGEPAAPAPITRAAYVVLHLRHFLGVLLVPVLGMFALQDAARLLLPDVADSSLAVPIQVAAVAAIAVFFPVLLRWVWDTRPLPAGPLRQRLEALAHRTGFRARQILVWQTGGMVVNAAVTGFLPRLRYVFLTDGLLARLNESEIEAVFGHEIGHLRHRHLLLRVAAMFVPMSVWLLCGDAVAQWAEHLELPWIEAAWEYSSMAPVGLAAFAVIVAYLLLVFGPYCRLLEGQADLFACQSLVSDGPTPPVHTFIQALENLAAACGIDRDAKSWQHASIGRRVELLQQLTTDPRREARFHRRVRLISAAVLAIVLGPLGYQLLLRL